MATALLYEATRSHYFFWNHLRFQGLNWIEIAICLVQGLRFDLYVILVMGLMPTLLWLGLQAYSSSRKHTIKIADQLFFWLWILFQVPFVVLNWADIEFINFSGRRFNSGMLFNLGEIRGGIGLGMIETYWGLTAVGVSAILIWVLGLRWILRKQSRQNPGSKRLLGLQALAVILFSGLGIRGGFQPKPLGLAHANISLNNQLNLMVLNSPFVVIRSWGQRELPQMQFLPEAVMASQLLGNQPGGADFAPKFELGVKVSGPINVVVIIVESLSYEYIGYPHGGQGYTPFLDQLAAKSLFFENSFANGRRSIEGISSITASIPALMKEPFVSSIYANNHYLSLASVLGKAGYESHFFHGGNNGTMFFDTFAKQSGFDHYYGAREYPNSADHDGGWGIYDEPFLKWSGTQITKAQEKSKKPFLATLFTLSSHQPFTLPAGYQGKFDKGTQDIHESLGYVDMSIRHFFEDAEKQDWYKRTLFVITADHTYKPNRPEYQNELGRYRVPIMFYSPLVKEWPKEIDTKQVVSHIDIFPSVLDFLGLELPEKNPLARSVFRPGNRWAVFGLDDHFYVVSSEHFMRALINEMGIASAEMYSTQADPNESNPINSAEFQSEKEALKTRLMAHLQYFTQAMLKNRLYQPQNKNGQ